MNILADRQATVQRSQQQELQENAATTTTTSKSPTVPPEIIQLIIDYLDSRDLVKVLTLNWTWAQLVAPKLWQEVRYTANLNRIVFLITKSVPPPSADCQSTHTPSLRTIDSQTTASSSSQAGEYANPPPPPKRRNSYPWPTLLPYHSMVHSLHVSLSSADMIQDLLDMIPCCTELRSFSIQSAIPTEDLLIRGAIASACNDLLDPLGPSGGSSALHGSASSASLASLASQCSQSGRHLHSHSHSLSLDPYNRTTTPTAGLQQEDDETIMASSTSQSGVMLSLLANSCPKLESIWFSGFHPVSVLGGPTDLRPKLPRFDLQSNYHAQFSEEEPPIIRPPSFLPPAPTNYAGVNNAQLPPVPPVPGANAAAAGCNAAINNNNNNNHDGISSPPNPAVSMQVIQSGIRSLHFVNCTLPPQYLMTMIQHSLPNLTELHLTQCWQGNPLQGSLLNSLAKICPGLKTLTLHATQSHRGIVTSEHILRLLEGLEGGATCSSEAKSSSLLGPGIGRGSRTESGPGVGRGGGGGGVGGNVGSLADFPLGTFHKTSYTAASVSSAGATIGSSSISNSNSSSSSALVTLPSSTSSTSDLTASIGADQHPSHHPDGSHFDLQQQQQHQQQEYEQEQQDQASRSAPRSASNLESLSVWFTHSILNQAIAGELCDRERHPKLRYVEFGSEDAFDVGEDLVRTLGERRPELSAHWVHYAPARKSSRAKGKTKKAEADTDVIRCLCKTLDDEGIMVMCETCQVWQHCSCVGLGEGKATPEFYYCELCQPQLHPFSVRDGVVLSKVDRQQQQKATASPSSTTKAPRKRPISATKDTLVDEATSSESAPSTPAHPTKRAKKTRVAPSNRTSPDQGTRDELQDNVVSKTPAPKTTMTKKSKSVRSTKSQPVPGTSPPSPSTAMLQLDPAPITSAGTKKNPQHNSSDNKDEPQAVMHPPSSPKKEPKRRRPSTAKSPAPEQTEATPSESSDSCSNSDVAPGSSVSPTSNPTPRPVHSAPPSNTQQETPYSRPISKKVDHHPEPAEKPFKPKIPNKRTSMATMLKRVSELAASISELKERRVKDQHDDRWALFRGHTPENGSEMTSNSPRQNKQPVAAKQAAVPWPSPPMSDRASPVHTHCSRSNSGSSSSIGGECDTVPPRSWYKQITDFVKHGVPMDEPSSSSSPSSSAAAARRPKAKSQVPLTPPPQPQQAADELLDAEDDMEERPVIPTKPDPVLERMDVLSASLFKFQEAFEPHGQQS
ncbi:Histone-Lysine N-Methyltransferase ash1l [Mortierella alpina]|nr:Histone-Lysine N-Methyltransferase ash1l [Mortierella alpina]